MLKSILYVLFYTSNGRLVNSEERSFKVCLIKLLIRLTRFNITLHININVSYIITNGKVEYCRVLPLLDLLLPDASYLNFALILLPSTQ